MRNVSEIRQLTGGRCLVCLEDGSSFPLYWKELHAYGIREEETVADGDYEKIMKELLPKRAKLCAMNFLKTMDRTEFQLRRKLDSLFYPEEIAAEAVEYVKKYRYIDDLRYALNYMEYRKESRSVRQMEQELLRKGVARETIREALDQMETPDEEAMIRMWMEKKHYSTGEADQKERERMYRFLMRKGFSSGAVLHAMRME